MEGEVKSWNAGLDYWVRFPLNKDISLPFVSHLFRINKPREMVRETVILFQISAMSIKQKSSNVTAGGGADYNLGKGTRIAAGCIMIISDKSEYENN